MNQSEGSSASSKNQPAGTKPNAHGPVERWKKEGKKGVEKEGIRIVRTKTIRNKNHEEHSPCWWGMGEWERRRKRKKRKKKFYQERGLIRSELGTEGEMRRFQNRTVLE